MYAQRRFVSPLEWPGLPVLGLVLLTFCSSAPKAHTLPIEDSPAVRGDSPQEEGVAVRPGTRLASLVATHREETGVLPEADGEDSQPFPSWFRVLLRKSLPGLPTSGEPQYPERALELLRWLETHQDFADEELAQRLEELRETVPDVVDENRRRARYPKDWNVEVPAGTKLDEVRRILSREFRILPPDDLEDDTPIPVWFRVYLRKTMPDLPRSGSYQYPRTSLRILQRLLDNPDSVEVPR